jgi:hypothetical protein
VDLNDPNNWMKPPGVNVMEKGIGPAREQELDKLEASDFDEDREDDEDDEEEDEEDEEDIPTRPPGPKRRPPGVQPPGVQPTSKDDLRAIILEKFEEGFDAYKLKKWLKEEGIVEEETGKFLDVRQITGYKSLLTRPQTTQENQKPADAQPAPKPGGFVIPPPRRDLEVHYEKLEKAVAAGNEAMAQIAVEGIYSEMEKGGRKGGGGGGSDDKVWALLTAILTENKGKSKLSELKELTEIVANLMPAQPEGKAEAVQMAEVMERTVHDSVHEATQTALQITGSKGKADKMGKCPSCEKLIPMDSLYCGYCGLAFKQDIREEEDEEEEDSVMAQQRQREEAQQRKKAELARKAVSKRPPAQRPPGATQPPAPAPAPGGQPRPQPQQPAPAGAAITSEERAGLLRNLKRLANFISNKDDPILKTQALFKGGDDDDRKNGVFLAIVGCEKLLTAAHRLIKEHPELSEFQHYVDLCDSADGRAWIDRSLTEMKTQAKLMGVLLKAKEANEMLDIMEARLGFPIE